MQLDTFFLILRILFVVLIYLFLMQVVIAITRDLRKTAISVENMGSKGSPVLGHLIVVDSGPSNILPVMGYGMCRMQAALMGHS
jgi:hypothetical protein